MRSWRSFIKGSNSARPAIVLCAALVLCTAFYIGTRSIPDLATTPIVQISAPVDEISQDALTAFRTERESSRIQQLAALDKLIEAQPVDDATLQQASQQKLELLASIEHEVTIEGALKLIGFTDPTCTVHDESINVFLRTQNIDDAQLAQILTICRDETGMEASNIKIIPIR